MREHLSSIETLIALSKPPHDFSRNGNAIHPRSGDPMEMLQARLRRLGRAGNAAAAGDCTEVQGGPGAVTGFSAGPSGRHVNTSPAAHSPSGAGARYSLAAAGQPSSPASRHSARRPNPSSR